MELVGLGYTGWFVYRYLLFKVSYIHHQYITALATKTFVLIFLENKKLKKFESDKMVDEFNDRPYKICLCELSSIGYSVYTIRIPIYCWLIMLACMP